MIRAVEVLDRIWSEIPDVGIGGQWWPRQMVTPAEYEERVETLKYRHYTDFERYPSGTYREVRIDGVKLLYSVDMRGSWFTECFAETAN